MRRIWLAAALSFVAPSTATWAAKDDAALRLAESRGAAIAAHDRAAWVATDAMIAALGDPGKAGVRGYMVVASGSDLRAIFYGDSSGGHVPIYEAVVREGAVASSQIIQPADRQPLDANVERLIRSRDAIWNTTYQRCSSGSMNTVVLPAESGDDTIVYLLTSQGQAGVYPAGGHHRITVSANGKVLERRAFTKSCIGLSNRDGPSGAKSAGAFITHLMDAHPTEIHVWLSRWMGIPVFVATADGRMWPVADGRIGEPRPLPERPAQ